jgi:hypothetical protein
MVGPCLCGDPYCGSCGDPSLAVLEEAEEKLMDVLHVNQATIEHYEILIEVIPKFVEAVNNAIGEAVQDLRADDEEYISYLKGRIDTLEMEQVYEEARDRSDE